MGSYLHSPQKNSPDKNSIVSGMENLSFLANQKGNSDNYFNLNETKYYLKTLENKMKDAKIVKKANPIKWLPGESLGQGSFGEVVLGFNENTGELMAVKQIKKGRGSSHKVDSLKVEIELLSHLKHEYIVNYLGANTMKNRIDIFLEYIAGGSISSLLKKYGKFNENIIRIYTTQILKGLEYLHWNGVIHRGNSKSN